MGASFIMPDDDKEEEEEEEEDETEEDSPDAEASGISFAAA